MQNNHITRRRFLKKTAASLAFPYVVSSAALGKAGAVIPSERITVGCIGVGPQGTGVMRGFLGQKDAQVVAVCDVKSNVLQDRQELVNKHYQGKGCQAYSDFRELVARDDIDACLVATCDHWHVLTSLAAVHNGKDVYMEKPMGLSLEEDQAMRQAVQRYGRIFQFGTQQRSSRHFRFACELVRNERIGKLHSINVWAPGSSAGGDPTPVPAPEWLDYDRWLGPAPHKPYTKDRCSNSLWWFISDYAIGFIAGWGIHPVDIAVWAAADKLQGPWEIEGAGQFPTQGVCDTAMNWDVTMQCANDVKMRFTGAPCRQEWKDRYGRTTDHGTAFEGTQGWVHVDRAGINAHPKSLLETKWGPNDIRLEESSHHGRNFLDCIKSRKPAISPVEDAVQSDLVCMISDVAIRLKRKLTWDPSKETFLNDQAANRRLRRPMRSPYRV